MMYGQKFITFLKGFEDDTFLSYNETYMYGLISHRFVTLSAECLGHWELKATKIHSILTSCFCFFFFFCLYM
jgi:hypothetical protein